MVNVLMVGSGEYVSGFVDGCASTSDKFKGVCGLVLFDMRRRGLVNKIGCVGTNGTKFPAIKEHFRTAISECYNGMDVHLDHTYPDDKIPCDPNAYKAAIDQLKAGDAITVFTPDNTHFDIALYAIERGVHVLLAKPAVLTVQAHQLLMAAARKKKVLVQVEFHKRWDQMYADARERVRDVANFGKFQYFSSYMSQPQRQLTTFKSWAGISSDISYYLNSHHIDLHCWMMDGRFVPSRAMAVGSYGVASSEKYGCPPGTEDCITIVCEWKCVTNPEIVGTATYTASWAAPDGSELHSQQRFVCLGHLAEIRLDQGHRGYDLCQGGKYSSMNPLYMKYTPNEADGSFGGQRGYGYLSIESFIEGCAAINRGDDFDQVGKFRPTLETTLEVTAILEAGRRSLDLGGGAWIDVQDLMKNSGGYPKIRFQVDAHRPV